MRGIALAPKGAQVHDLVDTKGFDFTSRVRSPEIGRVVVFQNTAGYFAAGTIVALKNESHGDDRDELVLDYVILTDGSDRFANGVHL